MRLVLLFLLLPFSVRAQSACRAEDHYEKWIAFERKTYGTRSYIARGINDSTGGYCYADLVRGRQWFFEYLFVHAKSSSLIDKLEAIKDSTKIRSTAIQLFQKDSLFTNTLNEWIARTVAGTKPKDTLDSEDVLDVAVKFFIIDKVSSEGAYGSHVCVGINGIGETMKKRNLLLEAFCYGVIIEPIQERGENPLYKEYKAALNDMVQVSFGEDHDARLHRAQGAMYLLMWRSQLLRNMLWEAYEAQKEQLPFVWTRKIK